MRCDAAMTDTRFNCLQTDSELSNDNCFPKRLSQKGFNIGRSVIRLVRQHDKRKQQQQLQCGMQEKPQVYVVGSPNPKSPFLRIVHVSDTCEARDGGAASIYEGDVLVHSGNLCNYQFSKHFFREAEFHNQVKAINEWFARMPHKYKIFVPGPNEIFFDSEPREKIQALLPNCIYLQDSDCLIEGVKFYGTPWCPSRRGNVGKGFYKSPAELKTVWSNVAEDVDVFVSHSVPTNSLYDELVTRIRPRLFLFGARQPERGRTEQPDTAVRFKDNVIFSNGHARNDSRRGLFDFYADCQCPRDTRIPSVSAQTASEALQSMPLSSRPALLRCIFS